MSYILPALILLLLLLGFRSGIDVYAAFARGAADALPLILKILPYMAAMLMAIGAFRASGALDAVGGFLAPALAALGLPQELLPMALLRPFSGSAAMALLADVYAVCGVDSYEGFAASLMLGSTETIFYVLALYCGAAGVRKTRYTLCVSLFCTVLGVWASLWLARVFCIA